MTYEPTDTHTQTIETPILDLEHALEELDRVIHRSRALLQRARVKERGAGKITDPWKAVQGIWKDRDVGNAVEYQRKMRDEFEQHAGV